jgi:NAD(P)-dependent dehydrogenase (short-subunit alcohol dehydrogenase family)
VGIEQASARSATEQLFRLDGKIALITGGTGMLGLRHAEAIAEMGGTPVLLDLDPARCADEASALRARIGSDAFGVAADITRESDVQRAVAEVAGRYGRIDILVNNAALTVRGGGSAFGDYFAPFEEYPQGLFDRALDVNLTGAFLVTQATGRVMKAQGAGVIVNIASDVAVISPDHRIYRGMEYGGKPFNTPVAYSMCKAAILAFTRYLATYWAEHGIRVNALSPAGVYDDHDPAFVERLSNLIPMHRMAHKDEYKGALVFLCSDASSFMTGANLLVDGGRTCW